MSSAPGKHHHANKSGKGQNAETTKYYRYAKKFLELLYRYSIGSLTHSPYAQCTCTCFQSNDGIEMVDFSVSKSERDSRLQSTKDMDMKNAVHRHFQSHFERWDLQRRFPWKVVLHLLLIVLVTVQVCYVTIS